MNEALFRNIYVLLDELSKSKGSNFAGTGLVVYDSMEEALADYRCSLRPNYYCPDDLKLANFDRLKEYLLEISDHQHPLHDGFHMVNNQGQLTHVSQYFAPPIKPKILPNPNHGARVHTAVCGSLIEGVILTGVVSSNGNIFMFHKGNVLEFAQKEVYSRGEEV